MEWKRKNIYDFLLSSLDSQNKNKGWNSWSNVYFKRHLAWITKGIVESKMKFYCFSIAWLNLRWITEGGENIEFLWKIRIMICKKASWRLFPFYCTWMFIYADIFDDSIVIVSSWCRNILISIHYQKHAN